MKLPRINAKSLFLIGCTINLFTLLIIFTPKFHFGEPQFATAFTNSQGGDWNDFHTWGISPFQSLSNPRSIAFSSTSEIYIADLGNSRILVLNPDGTASTSYDNLDASYSPAGFNLPRGIIFAPTGEMYITDIVNSRIVVLNHDGTASTSYNGSASTTLGSFYPYGIGFSLTGEIYAVDNAPGNRVVVFNPDGTVSRTYNGDTTPLAYPDGLTVSPTGELYIADINNDRITVLNPDGTASTTYDNLDAGYLPAGLDNPGDVTIAPSGAIYIVDSSNNRIVVLNPDGTASTTFNNSDASYSPAGFNNPQAITIAPSSDIYISDSANNRIVVLNPDGTASTTHNGAELPSSFIGTEGIHYPGINDNVTMNSGTVTLTQDQNAHNITLASGGTLDLNGHTLNVYGDWSNTGGTLINNGGTINFIGITNKIIGQNTFENLTKNVSTSSSLLFDITATTTITGHLSLSGSAGNLLSIGPNLGSIVPVFDYEIDGTSSSLFSDPYGVVHDSQDNIYISNCNNNDIQEFDKNGNFVKSFDTTGLAGGFNCPFFLAADSQDNIYTAENTGRIVKFDSHGNYATSSSAIVAFGGIAVSPTTGDIYISHGGSFDGVYELDPNFNILASTTATINGMSLAFNWGAVTIDPTGNYLYVEDSGNQRIVKLNASDLSFVSETQGSSVPFGFFADMTLDSAGNIYVSTASNTIIKYDPDFSYLTQFGSSGSGPGQFDPTHGQTQITVDSNNNIYVADPGNRRVEKFTQLSTPFNIVLDPAGSASLSYLSVFGSTNQSTSAFQCLTGCINRGLNTNWIFILPIYGGSSSYITPFTSSASTTTEVGGDTTEGTSTIEIIATTTPVIPSTSQKFTFTQTLRFGSIGEEVRQLQIFLNNHDFSLGDKGTGSSENETTYFGIKTKQAVIKFQEKYANDILTPQGLTQGTGIFLNYSRAKANEILMGE